MDVHVLRGIISSGVFLPRKDEMAQTTHVILDSIPWLLNSTRWLLLKEANVRAAASLFT